MRIFRVKSQAAAKELHERLDKLDAVAVSSDAAGSLEEFGLAHHLAKRAFADKTNIAKKMKYEFLLWLGGKTDIKSAMKETSPETNEFFVVLFSDAGRGDALELLNAKELPLGLEQKAGPLALERISLSRIR